MRQKIQIEFSNSFGTETKHDPNRIRLYRFLFQNNFPF